MIDRCLFRRLIAPVLGILAMGLFLLFSMFWSQETVPRVRQGAGFTYESSQRAGERALNEAAASSPTEDAWLFAGGTWTDVGLSEEPRSVEIDSAAFASALRRSVSSAVAHGSQHGPVMAVLYHIHLMRSSPEAVEPPSLTDLRTLAVLEEECSTFEGIELVGAVMDGRGRWAFGLSPEVATLLAGKSGQSRFKSADAPDYAVVHGYVRHEHNLMLFNLEYPPLTWTAFFPDISRSRADRIAGFVSSASKLGVHVEYQPF